MAESPFSTPKRKREEILADGAAMLNTASQFTFDPSSAPDDGNASPRTRVAHRFRGLALGGGGGGGGSGPSMDLSTPDHDAQDGSRKRLKLPDVEMPDAVSPVVTNPSALAAQSALGRQAPLFEQGHSPSRRRQSVRLALDDAVVEQSETIANTGGGNSSSSSSSPDDADADVDASTSTSTPASDSPSSPAPIHKLLTPPSSQPLPPQKLTTNGSHPSSRRGRRANTPPFPQTAPTHTTKPTKSTRIRTRTGTKSKPTHPHPSSTTSLSPNGGTETDSTITDPLGASLTWRDDEITVYDPDDSDDDGTGINGIGFKPTPAVAQARSFRRRQQLAEYRKREEREARARRSARRGGRGSGNNGGVDGNGAGCIGVNGGGSTNGSGSGSGSGSMGRGMESGMSTGAGGGSGGGVKKGRRRVRFLEGER